jgi:hypothetical protein
MPKSIACLLLSAAIGIFSGAALAQTPAPDALLAKADELSRQGEYDQAIGAASEALAAAEQAFGASDARLAKPLKTLARFYELQGQDAKAETYYQRALSILEGSASADVNEIAELKARLASIAAKQLREAQLGAVQAAKQPQARESHSRSIKRTPAAPPPPVVAPSYSAALAPEKAATMAPSDGAALALEKADTVATSRGAAQDRDNADADTVPFFPWPPPASSARYVFPQETFSSYSTVGDVSTAILKALEHSGYVERGFFRTEPGGVVLVTRLEKIGGDGTPAPEQERWPAGFESTPVGFIDFVRGLFYAKAGHYRVIAFVLQENAFTQSEQKATGKDAETWLAEGAFKLPAWLANRPFGKDSTCTALIYEFESDGAAVKSVVSSLTGKQHLQKAGVLTGLSAPN